jgi:transposase
VADCSGKSRGINPKKVTTPISYRSRRLYSLFGFLCLGGKSLARATQKCKPEDFLDFLQEIRSSNPDVFLIVILDNARIHRAKKVKNFCELNPIILVYLPPYSPNLNPIEFCWKDVQKKLSQFSQMTGEDFKLKGEEITQQFLECRQDSYTKHWREQFL